MIGDGRRLEREGQAALRKVVDGERARRVYDLQLVEEERRTFEIKPPLPEIRMATAPGGPEASREVW